MVALAALALVILRGGGEGVTGRGVIVTSGLVMVLACLVILWGRGEGVIGRGVMVTSDLVLAGVVKREAEDCGGVAGAMSQPPPNRLGLIGGSIKLSGPESEVSMSKVFAHLCDHEFRGKLGHIRHFFFL